MSDDTDQGSADNSFFYGLPCLERQKKNYRPSPNHTKLSTHIPNKKELYITAHASTPVLANQLPVYPGKSSM